jgi:hypothetical protein
MAKDFDAAAARRSVEGFSVMLAALEEQQPEVVSKLRGAWRNAYLTCGHKALGRLMIGRTIEEACRGFER